MAAHHNQVSALRMEPDSRMVVQPQVSAQCFAASMRQQQAHGDLFAMADAVLALPESRMFSATKPKP